MCETNVRRPVVLVFLPYYTPAFKAGGPVRTLANMVDCLSDSVDFRIFTRDRDLGDSVPFANQPIGRWVERSGARVFYGSARHRSPSALIRMVRAVRPDMIYVNGCLDASFCILPLVLRRAGLFDQKIEWLVAPRGELSPGALAIKRRKKGLFLRFSRLTRLHSGLVWHASTDYEAEDIRRAVGSMASEIRVAANPTASVEPLEPRPEQCPGQPLSVCFLSRISPKKNLLFAIKAVNRVRRPIAFVIYGPAEHSGYWEECQRAMKEAPPGSTIEWRGEVPPARIREMLSRHDVFLFPTRSENFGHVIFEALAAGVPVLVSDQTPWHDLEARGSGWVRSLDDPQGFVDVLEAAADRGPEEREVARRAAHAHALEVSTSEAVLGANRRLFTVRPSDSAGVLS